MNDKVFARLEKAKKIVIGLSGGADSVAMTHILLSQFGAEKLFCVHINHKIRADEASRDADFVKEYCKKNAIKYEICEFDVPKIAKEKGLGTEECARKIRYECFESFCQNNDVIATAHNKDDNAETVIFNLIRGTGISGIAGIPEIRGNIVRPILDLSKEEILIYCKEKNLEYVNDSTNFENEYSRNKIRNIVIPNLKEINSNVSGNILKNSKIIASLIDYVSDKVDIALKECQDEYGLDIKKLSERDDFLISEIIKNYIKNSTNFECNYEFKHIKEIVNLLDKSGAVCLPNGYVARVKQKRLCIFKENITKQVEILLNTQGETVSVLKKTVFCEKIMQKKEKINNLLFKNCIDYDKINGELVLSYRKSGDFFRIYEKNLSKSLKKLFNEYKIPDFLRDKLIIIRDSQNIVYIEKFGVSAQYCIDENTKNLYLIKIEG